MLNGLTQINFFIKFGISEIRFIKFNGLMEKNLNLRESLIKFNELIANCKFKIYFVKKAF